MKLAQKDWIFIAVIAAVLAAVFVGTGGQKARNVPYNEQHSRFHEVMRQGGERTETEKVCTTCHGAGAIPLSKGHPPKEQCLLCHKIVRQ